MKKILIVDDEILPRKSLQTILPWKELGYTVAGEAANGRAALEMAETLHPDLIFTDITMPVMNGIELIKSLKQTGNPAKVVVLSCHEDFNYLRDAMRLGAVDYLLKHTFEAVDIRKLIRKLDDIFSREHLEEESSLRLQQDVWRRFLLGQIGTGERIRYTENGILPKGREPFRVFCAGMKKTAKELWESLREGGEKPPAQWMRLIRWEPQEGGDEEYYTAVLVFAEDAGEPETRLFLQELTGSLYRQAAQRDLSLIAAGSLFHRDWQEIHAAYLEAAGGMELQVDLSLCGQKVRQAVSFIRDNYRKALSLENIADYAGISRIYLSQLFKKETGRNISDFLLDFRIGMARRLLRESSLKIYEIAEMTGFGSAQYFSHNFKEKTGQNPLEYRDQGDHNKL